MYSISARAKVDEVGGRNEEESGRSNGWPPAAPRLLDALRERLRYMHYSLRTEETYVYWVRGFVRWAGGRRHPRKMGAAEVQAFLSMLANERRVAAATHRQALSALLFLYREALGIDMRGCSSSAGPCRTSASRSSSPTSRCRSAPCSSCSATPTSARP